MALLTARPAVVLLWIFYLASWFPLSISSDPSILVSVDNSLFFPGGIYIYMGDSRSAVTDTSNVNVTKVTMNYVKIRSMDVNTVDGSVYFFDIGSRCIYRLNSDNTVDTIQNGVSSSVFSSIAYDWISRNLYWTDGFFNWIAVRPLTTTDKSMYRVIIQDDIEKPSALAVDANAGYMFWFDISPSGFRIERALLDGTVRVPIITTSLLNVQDIEIDAAQRRIYWTERGRDAIESSQYDGTDRKILYRELNINFRSIAVDTEDICITIHDKPLWSCISKATGHIGFLRSSEFLFAEPNIIAISKTGLKPRIPDGCSTLGCDHFCVNVQPNGKCMCKEGYTLDTDGLQCTEIHSFYHKGIVVSNATDICMKRVSSVTSHDEPLICAGNVLQGCHHLTVDAGNRLIYYVDTTSNYVREYNLVTKTIRQITPVSTVSGMAFDWTDGILYWSESSTGKLKYVSIATATARELLQVSSPPSHLTIDPHTRTLFWIEGTSGYAMSIVSMSLGSHITSVLLEQPSPAFIKDIFFDVTSDRLYYVQSNKLYSTSRNGSDTTSIYSVLQSVDQLIIYKRYAVWSETTSSKIYSKSLQQNDLVIINATSNLGMISGLAVFDEALQIPSKGPCFYMNGGCEQLCRTDISGTAVCACSYGLTLQTDGKGCSSVPQTTNFLLVPDFYHGRLFQISSIDAQITALDIDIVENPIHAVYDPETSLIFWSDLKDNSIMKSTLDGRNVDIAYTATGDDSYPIALAMDNSTGNLYFTVSGEADTISPGSVGVLKPSSGMVRTLVRNLNTVYGLALYPSKGLMFYTHKDLYKTFVNIVRVSMDGSFPNVIISLDTEDFLTSLSIDYNTDRLYWSSTKGGIESSSLSGTSRQKFTTSTNDIRSVVVVGSYLYLTSERHHKVVKMNLQTETEVSFMNDNAELGLILNLFVYPGQTDLGESVCSNNNGGCSTFCLPRSSVTSSYCACQDGTNLKGDDLYTCVGMTRCPSAVSNGKLKDPCIRNVGDTCYFQCNPGYTSTIPAKTVTCGQDGQWNGNLQLLCQLQDTCSLVLPNGRFESTCTPNAATTCDFSCNSGYRSTLPSNMVTCGQNGQWNANLQLLCQLVPSCSSFLPNGQFEGACIPNAGNTCSFKCNDGYTSTSSPTTMTCEQNGAWNTDIHRLCQLTDKTNSSQQTSEYTQQTFIYIGAGLVGLIVVSVTIVAIVCVKKRRSGMPSHSHRSEPNVYYTPYQTGSPQGGMIASGVINQGMYDVVSPLPEKTNPTGEVPTPPYHSKPENTYETIPAYSAYSEPAPPYEEPNISHGPSLRSEESSIVSIPSGSDDYLTLFRSGSHE